MNPTTQTILKALQSGARIQKQNDCFRLVIPGETKTAKIGRLVLPAIMPFLKEDNRYRNLGLIYYDYEK